MLPSLYPSEIIVKSPSAVSLSPIPFAEIPVLIKEEKESSLFKVEDNLSLSLDFEFKLNALLNEPSADFLTPSVGGGGGASLFISDAFFIKFKLNPKELLGNILYKLFEERVPETKTIFLSSKVILNICARVEDKKFKEELNFYLKEAKQLKVMVLPRLKAIQLGEIYKLKPFVNDPKNILFLASELARIAIKDCALRVGDRMIPHFNPGNVMLSFDPLLGQYGKNLRLLVIDNDVERFFSEKTIKKPSKKELCYWIQDMIKEEALKSYSKIEGIEEAINLGIEQGLSELKRNKAKIGEVKLKMTGEMKEKELDLLLASIEKGIDSLLKK